MKGAPDDKLTPDWIPGERHDPEQPVLAMWRLRTAPHVGWWTRWGQEPVRPGGVWTRTKEVSR